MRSDLDGGHYTNDGKLFWNSVDEFRNALTLHNLTVISTGRFIMFFVTTNIYNKKTKGPTLMEVFTATGKLKKKFSCGCEQFH